MTLLELRLGPLLATKPEWLQIPEEPDGAEARSFRGRYVQIGERPFALGRELGRGEEAIVFELIDLRTGRFDYVVKVCRHLPGTDRYRRWAVPVRFQRNPAAANPDIEMVPCHLIPVPGGGVVKVQRYLSPHPATDWLSRLPLVPAVAKAVDPDSLPAVAACLEAMVREHGERAVFLELKGQLAAETGQLDEALEFLIRALALHLASGSSSRYCAALTLAQVMEEIYQRDRSKGAAEVSLKLDDDTILRNTFFSFPAEAARDDSLQDRSLFCLLEVMGDLPYFVGGLTFILSSLMDLTGSSTFKMVARALARIDPGNPMLQQLQDAGLWCVEDDEGEPPAVSDLVPEQGHAPVDVPAKAFQGLLQEHEGAYNPETMDVRAGSARIAAAMADVHRGNDRGAEANLREAIRLDPEIADFRIVLATFLFSRGQKDESVRVLEDAIERIGGAPVVRLYLVSTLLRCGRLKEAKRALLRARPLLPEWGEQLRLLESEIAEQERMQ